MDGEVNPQTDVGNQAHLPAGDAPRNILFSPFKIGSMSLTNRIVQAPMHSNFADPEGGVSERLLSYIDSQSKGGAGLVYVEHASVEAPRGNNSPITLNVSHERYVAGLAELADVVHQNGAKVALQIDHAGRQASLKATRNQELISCSDVSWVPSGTRPRAVTVEEIKDMVGKSADAALRVQFAGFDAVTVHAGHGYLLSSFLSPFANKRTDQYGGSVRNRARFLLEIVAACRERVGDSFPILCRLNGADHLQGGLSNEDVIAIARMLEDAGVDALDMTSGTRESGHWQFPPLYAKSGLQLEDVRAVRGATTLPLIAIGKISSPELAASIVRENVADLVSFGRELLADPEMPRKIREGRSDEIRPCLYCNDCMQQIRSLRGVACTVNPALGRERRLLHRTAERRRKIAVIGGGPGGLVAAASARRRGHDVTLYERRSELGGALRLSAKLPYRDGHRRWLTFLIGEAQRQGVQFRLNETIDVRSAGAFDVDEIIVSVGAGVAPMGIVQFRDVRTVQDLLERPEAPGRRVLVADVSQEGCEAALMLSATGMKVDLVGDEFAGNAEAAVRNSLVECLASSGIVLRRGMRVTAAAGATVSMECHSGESIIAEYDTLVVPSTRLRNDLVESFVGSDRAHVIGDASGTAGLMAAVRAAVFATERL